MADCSQTEVLLFTLCKYA